MISKTITVKCWGAGGGGAATSGYFWTVSGGAGGGFGQSDFIPTLGSGYTVTVGIGVVGNWGYNGAPAPTYPTAGGDSWFSTISTIKGAGGNAGNIGDDGAYQATPVTGSSGIGDITHTGGTSSVNGAGGGGPGDTANGSNASGSTGGNGGSTGGGKGGDYKVGLNVHGDDGAIYGSGGGGAHHDGNSVIKGGSGANGKVVITAPLSDCVVATGGVHTTDGTNDIWTFTSTGTFTVTSSLPVVTTQDVTDRTATTGTGNGNVISDGGLTITERGICWSTSHTPTISNSKVTSSGTTGAFTGAITGLSALTTYYARAYAVNSAGTSYGVEVSFTTKGSPVVTTQNETNITSTTATGNGTVVTDNEGTITERGVCWSLTTNPTTSDFKATTSGTTGSYTVNITGLTESTLYYSRAYAINAYGTSYGSNVTFSTPGRPTLTTEAASSIDLYSAVLNGTVISDGGHTVSERGLCYGTSTTPTTAGTKVVVSGTTGAYYGLISSLTSRTLYYVRAYATNALGTNYGNQITFTSLTAGDKQLIKNISGIEGQIYAVSLNVGGSAGTVTVKLGTTGYSQVINAGAGVTVVQGAYSGLSGLIIESSVGFIGTIDNVMYVLLIDPTQAITWTDSQIIGDAPIDSSVKFKRVEDKELTRFDLYRYLDTEFKDLDGYVTLIITEEANDKSQNRNKTFVVGNETGVVSPFVKKRISMLSKNQALVIQFSNAKLNETFTVCQYQLTGFKEPRKLYKLSKIISI